MALRNNTKPPIIRVVRDGKSPRASGGGGATGRRKYRAKRISALWTALLVLALLLTLWTHGALMLSIEDKRVDLDDGGWPVDPESRFALQRRAASARFSQRRRGRGGDARLRGVRRARAYDAYDEAAYDDGGGGDAYGEEGGVYGASGGTRGVDVASSVDDAGSTGNAARRGAPVGAAPSDQGEPDELSEEISAEQKLRNFLIKAVHRGGVDELTDDDLWNTAIVELAKKAGVAPEQVQRLGSTRTLLLARWYVGERPSAVRQFLAANDVLPLVTILTAAEMRNTLIVALNRVVGIDVGDLQLMSDDELATAAEENAATTFGDTLVLKVFGLSATRRRRLGRR